MHERFKNLPHHQLIFAGVVVLVLGGYIVYDRKPWVSWGGIGAQDTTSETSQPLPPISREVDSDGDGLPDWKERLYGSDMYAADTDGDGTNDGDEVFAGRDPNKAGPDDAFTYLGDIGTSTGGIDEERRQFLSKFLRERSVEIQEDVFRTLTERFDPRPLQPRYTLQNLTIVSNASTSSIKEFGNRFGTIIETYTSTGVRSEDDIIKEMMFVKDEPERATRVLQALELPAINYRNFAADLAKIPVPIDLAQYHLDIVNGYDVMSRGLLGMRELYTNPVQGAGAYQAYLVQKANVTVGYAGLVYEFTGRGVIFAPNEPGAPFTWAPPTE